MRFGRLRVRQPAAMREDEPYDEPPSLLNLPLESRLFLKAAPNTRWEQREWSLKQQACTNLPRPRAVLSQLASVS